MDYLVVIPSCNRYDLLQEAVRSALAQTIPPRAVWVIDDASTDPRYLDKGDELASESVHVCRRDISSKAEHGCGYAIGAVRNTALHAVLCGLWNGWVAFLDDDDAWRPEKMAATAAVAAAYPDAVAIGTDATVINQDGQPIGFYGAVGGDEIADELLDVTPVAAHANPLTCSTVAMPMRVIRQIGLMQPIGYCEDWDYWYRASSHGRLLRITRDLAMYRKGHAKEWSL